MPIDPKDWYQSNPDYAVLNQGDVLDGVPTVVMPSASKTWVLLRPAHPVTVLGALSGQTPKSFRPRSESDTPDAWVNGEELVLAKGSRRRVMLVNHGCDLDHRNYLQLARVYNAAALATKAESLRGNEITYAFFLPASPPDFPEDQFADLSQLSAVHKSYLREAILVRRLSARATFELQRHLASFYGRPFGFSIDDNVAESGQYLCANCFYTDGVLVSAGMTAGDKFTPCSRCTVKAVWLKAPPIAGKASAGSSGRLIRVVRDALRRIKPYGDP
jgi:hypothetical protein